MKAQAKIIAGLILYCSLWTSALAQVAVAPPSPSPLSNVISNAMSNAPVTVAWFTASAPPVWYTVEGGTSLEAMTNYWDAGTNTFVTVGTNAWVTNMTGTWFFAARAWTAFYVASVTVEYGAIVGSNGIGAWTGLGWTNSDGPAWVYDGLVLEWSSNLVDWTPLFTNTAPTLPVETWTETDPSAARGFYRARVLPGN